MSRKNSFQSLRPPTRVFSVTKSSEGGVGQRFGLFMLREAGIPCRPAHSCFAGESGIEVLSSNRRILARASRILFGRS